jgi:hypothetical protein
MKTAFLKILIFLIVLILSKPLYSQTPDNSNLQTGATILAIGYTGLLGASIAILGKDADVKTSVGRHLWAGALANAALCVAEIYIVTNPLRKGERWAWWVSALPIVVYGIPILILDALNVSSDKLFLTLVPQVAGLVLSGIGLTLTAKVALK